MDGDGINFKEIVQIPNLTTYVFKTFHFPVTDDR